MSGDGADVSQLRGWSARISDAAARAPEVFQPVVARAAINIKRTMQDDLRRSRNPGIRYVAGTVRYDDPELSGATWTVKFYPDKPEGGLANVAYFGTSKGGGHTRRPVEAVEAELGALRFYAAETVRKLF